MHSSISEAPKVHLKALALKLTKSCQIASWRYFNLKRCRFQNKFENDIRGQLWKS
jgi:hypothetical protein